MKALEHAAEKAALARDVGDLRLQLAELLDDVIDGRGGQPPGSISWSRGEGKAVKEVSWSMMFET